VGAFWHSVRHARPLAIGLNCALGATLMRPYIEELSKIAGDTAISCYPNAGLPNPMSDTGFDETPEVTGRLVEEFARDGFLNIAGGCCGTTPDHIRAIARAGGPLPAALRACAALTGLHRAARRLRRPARHPAGQVGAHRLMRPSTAQTPSAKASTGFRSSSSIIGRSASSAETRSISSTNAA
jgi:hypothetical protein